jgi:hypothetical protein
LVKIVGADQAGQGQKPQNNKISHKRGVAKYLDSFHILLLNP